jgi:predicted  nucleic acid-binding Zn-ribbon protein
MNSQIYNLGCLAFIESKLDELDEEFGELPREIKERSEKLSIIKKNVAETQKILVELRKFTQESRTTIVQLKEKEEKLGKQQFQVRNNKEFDAITKEIEHSRSEYNRIVEELRSSGLKEENLSSILASQTKEVFESENELKQLQEELDFIQNDQADELKKLRKIKQDYIKEISDYNKADYDRIRGMFKDAVVMIKRNSCSGCFSSLPPQKIVEIRNNLDTIYHCENCGRIVYPEDLIDKDSII